MKLLTFSQMRDLRKCDKYYWWKHVAMIRPVIESPALRFGSIYHYGLDCIKQGQTIEDAQESLVTYAGGLIPLGLNDEARNSRLVEMEIACQMVEVWANRYQDSSYRVVASEIEFNVPLVNPDTGRHSRTFRLAGKMDCFVESEGRLYLMEHKTASESLEPDSNYWKRLRMDGQISTYWLACKQMDKDIMAVIYDVARKPDIKPRKGETIQEYGKRFAQDLIDRDERYFSRREVARLQSDLDEAAADIWMTAKKIRDCERFNRWPRNTDACCRFGTCEYLNLCSEGYDIETQGIPEGFFKSDKLHPELSRVA